MFGDNKSVVDSSMQINTKLHKIHTVLSFHRVGEAMAAGTVAFHILSGDDNPADILSKHWGYTQIKERVKALLFWKEDAEDIQEEEATFHAKGECHVFSASSRGIPSIPRTPFHRNQPVLRHAKGKAITEIQDMPFDECLKQDNYQYKW
jgi:hypothetical protein